MLSRNALSSCSRNSKSIFDFSARSLATAVETPRAVGGEPSAPPTTAVEKRPKKAPRPPFNAAVILNRSPIITRTPSVFERAYYKYQQHIQRALHNPFPYEFYFKPGSLLETKFNMEEARRDRAAFGRNFGQDWEGAFPKPAAGTPELGQEEVEEPAPRRHEADEKKDVKSLDRKGQRNLYLLLKKKENGAEKWVFPQSGVENGELLHQAAERGLFAECGPHMNTWIVSRNPIGVQKPSISVDASGSLAPVTFFYKAHIMAGQVRPDGANVLDFAWLTKQEMKYRMDESDWSTVEDILSDF